MSWTICQITPKSELYMYNVNTYCKYMEHGLCRMTLASVVCVRMYAAHLTMLTFYILLGRSVYCMFASSRIHYQLICMAMQ